MKYSKKRSVIQKLSMALIACFIVSGAAYAQAPQQQPSPQQQMQTDFSDQELKAFITSADKVGEIQKEGEEKMIRVIEENELDVNTFNTILQAKQQNAEESIAPEQMEVFERVMPEVLQEQQKVNTKIEKSLAEEGLNLETYQGIMMAYQQVPAVQERVHKLMEEK